MHGRRQHRKLDGDHFWANRGVGLWNLISRTLNWMAGSFIFCEAAAFRKVGGFSNELFASEELDLSKRLKQLAAESKKKIVILDQHPLLTSARKIQLYTLREHVWFLAPDNHDLGRDAESPRVLLYLVRRTAVIPPNACQRRAPAV